MSDIRTVGVVMNRSRPFMMDTHAGAVGGSLGDLAAFASRKDLDVQKVVSHRAHPSAVNDISMPQLAADAFPENLVGLYRNEY